MIEMLDNKKMYSNAVRKTINSVEVPVKQKHVRSVIIGTFHEEGAQTFWMLALKKPYLDDRIVAWKLCHVVHKVLREGHPLCLVHSQRHRRDLDDTGKVWCLLKEGLGRIIRLYTNMLMAKLDFHKRNPRFPGHLGVTATELESIGANDINNYFQLSTEMFDYLDSILELQQAVFGSLNMSRSKSVTTAAQCRLAPLIMCIQDASRLYDYCVKILFKLHSMLPTDLLVGHRNRFLNQFKQLKQFYLNASALQYFSNLISVPPLPEEPPNFLREAELRSYVTQKVVVPDEPPEYEPMESNLTDTSNAESVDRNESHSQSSISPADLPSAPYQMHTDPVSERDDIIQYLQHELGKLRNENDRLQRENVANENRLREQIRALETSLAGKESKLLPENQIKKDVSLDVGSRSITRF